MRPGGPAHQALLAAVREVADHYDALSIPKRPEVGWSPADDALETALRSGDETRALAAVAAWRDLNLALLAEASGR